jgi:hypothetical protein
VVAAIAAGLWTWSWKWLWIVLIISGALTMLIQTFGYLFGWLDFQSAPPLRGRSAGDRASRLSLTTRDHDHLNFIKNRPNPTSDRRGRRGPAPGESLSLQVGKSRWPPPTQPTWREGARTPDR